MNKLKIIKNKKLLVTLKFKYPGEHCGDSENSEGGLDLMIDAGNGKKKYFEITCLSTVEGFLQCQSKISSISWHGFYYKDNKEIKLPIIRIKEDGKEKCYIRHTGIISMKEICLFPICSFYIPQNISVYNFSNYQNSKENVIELIQDYSARIDLFVLPRFMLFEKYINSFTHSFLELISDITMYDKSVNCPIQNLPIDSTNKSEIKSFVINNYTVVARIIYTMATREGNLIKNYSVLFHDPNNLIESVLSRRILYDDAKGEIQSFKMLKDIYINEKDEKDKPKKIVGVSRFDQKLT